MKVILLVTHCRTYSGQVREHCARAQAHTAHYSRGNACSKAVHATDLCCRSLHVQESSSCTAFHTGFDSAVKAFSSRAYSVEHSESCCCRNKMFVSEIVLKTSDK